MKKFKLKLLNIAGAVLVAASVFLCSCDSSVQPAQEGYELGWLGEVQNEDYDVSEYYFTAEMFTADRTGLDIPSDYLSSYSWGKLDNVDTLDSRSARGVYQDYLFEIVRCDLFEEWYADNGFEYTLGGDQGRTLSVCYDIEGSDGSETKEFFLYMDPSGRFAVVTRCRDYKVIYEFFHNEPTVIYYQLGAWNYQVTNDIYDISEYLIDDPNALSFDGTVDPAELQAYAEEHFVTLSSWDDISVRGVSQGYLFEVVRTDCFSDWCRFNGLQANAANEWSGASVGYNCPIADGGAMTEYRSNSIYMDPSGEFIIVTGCNDYKVIYEFFNGEEAV